MKKLLYAFIAIFMFACSSLKQTAIDRKALVNRNNPHINAFDSLASLSVGNGEFAYTVDATGLQTFPQKYTQGVPLGTESQWGWHSFANPNNYRHEETLKNYNFRGKEEPYSTQFNEAGRPKEAADWFRINPHRLHLGIIGFELSDTADFKNISNVKQELDMWKGLILSQFNLSGKAVSVETTCHPQKDMIGVKIISLAHPAIKFQFPYPSGGHSDDGCDWNSNEKHSTTIISQTENSALLERKIDATIYYINIQWEGNASLIEKENNYFVLQPTSDDFAFTAAFSPTKPTENVQPNTSETQIAAYNYWNSFWTKGGAVDFSQCKDKRAPELERRVVLSQYLLAIQCAGSVPPQETGLTYNSWYGKFHLEMIWWHEAQFALWGRSDLLERTLDWYNKAYTISENDRKLSCDLELHWKIDSLLATYAIDTLFLAYIICYLLLQAHNLWSEILFLLPINGVVFQFLLYLCQVLGTPSRECYCCFVAYKTFPSFQYCANPSKSQDDFIKIKGSRVI